MKIIRLALVLMEMLIGFTAANAGTPPGTYHELKRFHLGGDGGWDFLTMDSASRRLYLARFDRVMVIDGDSGKSLGEVKGLDGAHGVALYKERNLGFATSGKSGEVFIFDLSSLKVIEKIKVGEKPDAILYDPATKRIFVFNGKSEDVTVIDPDKRARIGRFAVNGKPECAESDGHGKIFLNLEDKSEVLAIDAKEMKVSERHALKPCLEPTGLAFDSATGSLIAGCGNELSAIVSAASGKVLSTVKVGKGVDGAAFDSARKTAFVPSGDGHLAVLAREGESFRLIQNLATIKSARTLAVDEKTGNVFLPYAEFEKSTEKHPKLIPGTFGILVVGPN